MSENTEIKKIYEKNEIKRSTTYNFTRYTRENFNSLNALLFNDFLCKLLN